jgi:cytochrome c553
MNHSKLFAALALVAAFSANAADPEAGQTKSATCAACHGVTGVSANPIWPSLAGQHESYIVQQLQAYQNGTRSDPMMTAMAMGLSEQDMQDIAAFYSRQTPPAQTAEPELVDVGQALYRGGNMETGVPACIACHGAEGAGNPAAGWPRVGGQHAEYTAKQLTAYRAGTRTTDTMSMMRDIAKRMSDEEIIAVANYLQGLR